MKKWGLVVLGVDWSCGLVHRREGGRVRPERPTKLRSTRTNRTDTARPHCENWPSSLPAWPMRCRAPRRFGRGPSRHQAGVPASGRQDGRDAGRGMSIRTSASQKYKNDPS